MDKVSNQRKVVIGASAVGMLCTFLPWANAPLVGSVSGTEGDGWITFFVFLVPIVLALRGNRLLPMGPRAKLASVAAAVVAGAIGIWKILDINSVKGELDDNAFGALFSSSVSVGFGLYLLVLAAIAVAVGAWFIKDNAVVKRPAETKL